ncbi:hypothetical protein [Streptomyces sp. NPDC018711]|uniref:hypothetical protein n=1 Tax=Streptomyces sp. NPDC018711 TaxID=3365052 RepID=UPI0037961389
MRKIPENCSATPTFEDDLRELYEAAGGKALTLGKLAALRGKPEGIERKVGISSLSPWLRGERVPRKPEHVAFVLQVLIPELERHAALRLPGYAGLKKGTWAARLRAAQDVSKRKQGGNGTRVNDTSPGRLLGGPSPALRDVLPREFVGRERELGELTEFVTGHRDEGDYLWYQAGPWAGKTALLAWFASRYQMLAGVDFAHHFVSGRLGTDRREDFIRVIGEQLAVASGKRRRPPLDPGQPTLDPWYEVAAQECEKRGRRLVLIVDGLDEDADAALDGHGIAGLLPKAPPHGMRVIVSGRPHPRIPTKLVADHPLRNPAVVRWLTDSPDARIIRDTALTELDALLDDPGIGQRLLGLLVSARGALSGADLGHLVGCTPREVKKNLRTVARRSVTPTRADLLPLDVRTHAEAEVGRQTFVLAHAELLAAAGDELGEPFLDECVDDLHRWARHWQEKQWPENTPNYLLTGYTRLVQEKAPDRLATLVLDPRRQLRLAQRSGPDVALRDLDLLTPPGAIASSPSRAAETAMSRELLLPHVRPLPAPVARAVARLGDPRRARALAGASGSAVDRALNLADVARVLQAAGDEQAADTVREAEKWARTALREAGSFGWAVDEAEAAAAHVALVMLETAQAPGHRDVRGTADGRRVPGTGGGPASGVFGRPGRSSGSPQPDSLRQHAGGLALLRSTRGTGSARNEAWARAALLLTPDHPEQAEELLAELEDQAEQLACEDPVDGSAAAGAVQLWQTVASAAPDRAERLHARVLAHVREMWEAAPTLENVSVVAAAAPFVAQSRPVEAQQLVAAACRQLEHVLSVDPGRLSAADAFHAEFGFRHTLAVFSQALTDVGASPKTIARVRELGHRFLPSESADESGHPLPGGDEDHVFAEAAEIAEQAFRLADRGANDEAEHHLEQALALLAMSGPGKGRGPVWLPDLAGALIRTDPAADAEPLLDLVQHPTDRLRVHAALAMAYADCHQAETARHHAQEASRAAASPAISATNWPYAAQALACAGEVEPALDLIAQHGRPDDAGKRAAWRKTDRAARIAIATDLAALAPETAGELIHPLLKRLAATRHAIRSQGLLTRLVELLPAADRLPPEQRQLFDTAWEEARAQATRSSPQSWQPEDVLVQAFLRIGSGEDPGRQLDWLAHDMANRTTEHFPIAALVVLHAALGDTVSAERVAALPAVPQHRAIALTAMASHLTRVPVRPCPVPDPSGAGLFTRTIQHLALKTTPATPPATQAAVNPLRHALTTAGWHHAIPILPRLAPEAVTAIRDIAVVHHRASGGEDVCC